MPRAEDRDDDGEADGGLGGGDDHDEEDKDLSLDGVAHVGKGDKGEIDSVEHELDRHEDGDDVALDKKAADADGEEHCGQDEVVADGDHGWASSPFGRGRPRRGWRRG